MSSRSDTTVRKHTSTGVGVFCSVRPAKTQMIAFPLTCMLSWCFHGSMMTADYTHSLFFLLFYDWHSLNCRYVAFTENGEKQLRWMTYLFYGRVIFFRVLCFLSRWDIYAPYVWKIARDSKVLRTTRSIRSVHDLRMRPLFYANSRPAVAYVSHIAGLRALLTPFTFKCKQLPGKSFHWILKYAYYIRAMEFCTHQLP